VKQAVSFLEGCWLMTERRESAEQWQQLTPQKMIKAMTHLTKAFAAQVHNSAAY